MLKLKIVTWNCNGAFRKKFERISELNADIYVIQECEDPKTVQHHEFQSWSKNHLWIGDSKNKGLGIFAQEEIELRPLEWSNQYQNHTVKYFLPCSVNNQFNLLAVWAHSNNSPNFGYIGQFWKYLNVNREKLNESLILGDFNSNVIWDQWDRWWNHSDVVRELKEIGIESFYHWFYDEEQGKETQPTLYFRKSQDRTYHIDYIFGPKKMFPFLSSLEVGKQDTWLSISDHMPICCQFSEPITNNK